MKRETQYRKTTVFIIVCEIRFTNDEEWIGRVSAYSRAVAAEVFRSHAGYDDVEESVEGGESFEIWNSKAFPPRCLARYIAASACRNRSSIS